MWGRQIRKAQSATEYLITYGWAIILIVMVVAILFKLGVFASTSFSTRASPGSCVISKPYGPNTTRLISLSGVCNNALPEYVDDFSGSVSFFDIEDNMTNIGTNNTITITTWTYIKQFNPNDIRENLISVKGRQYHGGFFAVNDSKHTLELGIDSPPYPTENDFFAPSNILKTGTWYFFAATYNGAVASIYVNGVLEATNVIDEPMDPGPGLEYIGSDSSGFLHYLNGSEANVQIYNVSLSKSEIQQLYYEGIGGVPTDLEYLQAWWPLNGNANDYSGNNNNGGPTAVTFDNTWTSHYTPP